MLVRRTKGDKIAKKKSERFDFGRSRLPPIHFLPQGNYNRVFVSRNTKNKRVTEETGHRLLLPCWCGLFILEHAEGLNTNDY